jgi:hypothetical protein
MDAALNFILSPDELRVLQVFCSTEIKKPKTYSFRTEMARNFQCQPANPNGRNKTKDALVVLLRIGSSDPNATYPKRRDL